MAKWQSIIQGTDVMLVPGGMIVSVNDGASAVYVNCGDERAKIWLGSQTVPYRTDSHDPVVSDVEW